ncbi:DUF551 domain-containing protein [Serratia marcescens]|uniref:DUF551 domain-containing protein n=1 Tax=Serratia marcescens TaxID=615 RepID=UPI0007453DB7|nr:DUF551 domain-containing protein [Serratia marcescens]CVB25490.1 Protein of uncharacterised function (DUF551) [Serratia marcescens]
MTQTLTTDELRQIVETDHTQCGDAAAMARELLAYREAVPVLYASEETLAYAKEGEKSLVTWSEPMGDAVIPLFTAPPAPAPALQGIDKQAIADRVYSKCLRIPGATFYNAAEFAIDEIGACLAAAMNSAAQPAPAVVKLPTEFYSDEGVVVRLEEVMAALALVGVKYERKGGACRAAMLGNGNSPEIPDGWVPCSERLPDTDGNYWGWWSESKRQGPVWFIKSDVQAQFQSSEITHWMPLPAAPEGSNEK